MVFSSFFIKLYGAGETWRERKSPWYCRYLIFISIYPYMTSSHVFSASPFVSRSTSGWWRRRVALGLGQPCKSSLNHLWVAEISAAEMFLLKLLLVATSVKNYRSHFPEFLDTSLAIITLRYPEKLAHETDVAVFIALPCSGKQPQPSPQCWDLLLVPGKPQGSELVYASLICLTGKLAAFARWFWELHCLSSECCDVNLHKSSSLSTSLSQTICTVW